MLRMVKAIARELREDRRIRRATLPWRELEAEAARQGCSPADIFFDRAGRTVGLPGGGDPHSDRGGSQGHLTLERGRVKP